MKKHAFCYKEFIRVPKHHEGPPKPWELLEKLREWDHVCPFQRPKGHHNHPSLKTPPEHLT